MLTAQDQAMTQVVKSVETIRPATRAELESSYSVKPYLDLEHGQAGFAGLGSSLSQWQFNVSLDPKAIDQLFQNALSPGGEREFYRVFGQMLIARLGTEERLTLAKRGSGSLNQGRPVTLLQALYVARSEGEANLNRLLWPSFGVHVRLDFTAPPNFVLRVGGKEIDEVPVDPRDALSIFPKFAILDEQGDGLRSFTTVLLAVDTLRRSVYLIDEPEAFLHPPQAYRLGLHLARASSDRQMIVSTHNTDMLRGLLADNRPATVARLTRVGNMNHLRVLNQEQLSNIARDPVLNSARVIDGLFYEGVVVAEADSDRAFYETVGRRLAPDAAIHYTHAQNKQTVPRVVAAYEEIGIPVASIVDLDILRRRDELLPLLRAHRVPASDEHSILEARSRLTEQIDTSVDDRYLRARAALEELLREDASSIADSEARLDRLGRASEKIAYEKDPWRQIKESGTAGFGAAKAEAEALLQQLRRWNIFLVPEGELEGWLRNTPLPRKDKRAWITAALPLLVQLEIRHDKEPWSFMQSIIESLRRVQET
ncbi:MAG TPA: AAA family ATPase [Candidatus Baltobacteraceae bacterium]|nr:AAA family ATPase [Candidatus Baltobacteraceae bacterium]